MQLTDAFDDVLARAALCSMLDDAVVLPGRLHHLPAFEDVVRSRLLDVGILARLAGPDHTQGVPVIGRREGHRVDRGVIEQATHVINAGDIMAGPLAVDLDRLTTFALVAVTHCCELDVLTGLGLQFHQTAGVGLRASTHPDDSDAHPFVDILRTQQRRCREGTGCSPQRDRGLQEFTTRVLGHGEDSLVGVNSETSRCQSISCSPICP